MDKEYRVTDFTRDELEQIYTSHNSMNQTDSILSLWSPLELKLLSETSPSTAKNIFDATGITYPIDSKSYEEQAKILCSFLTLSIDNALFTGVTSKNTVKSKIDNLDKLHKILGINSSISKDDVNENNIIELSYEVKKQALDVSSRFEKEFDNTSFLSNLESRGFEGFFVDLFGDNLRSILLYGSSTNGNGKDYDLMVFVNNLSLDMYQKMWNKQKELKTDKPVGIVLLPQNALARYAECDYHSLNIAREAKLLYGEPVVFPCITEEEATNKLFYKAGKEFTSLRATLNSGSLFDALVKAPGFLRHTLKLEIWIRKALYQKKTNQYLSKGEFLDIEPINIVDLGENPTREQVYSSLLDANFRVKEAVDRYFVN